MFHWIAPLIGSVIIQTMYHLRHNCMRYIKSQGENYVFFKYLSKFVKHMQVTNYVEYYAKPSFPIDEYTV